MSWKSMQSTKMTLRVSLRTHVTCFVLLSTAMRGVSCMYMCEYVCFTFLCIYTRRFKMNHVPHNNLHVATGNNKAVLVRCKTLIQSRSPGISLLRVSSCMSLCKIRGKYQATLRKACMSAAWYSGSSSYVQSVQDSFLYTPSLRWRIATNCMNRSPVLLFIAFVGGVFENPLFSSLLTDWLTMRSSAT